MPKKTEKVKTPKIKLGRGFGELFGEVEKDYENSLSDNAQNILEIDIDLIKPNPLQPRRHFDESSLNELADSIREYGVLQPILLYKDGDDYFLIAGERRLRASKIAKIQSIKAIVADIKPEKLREIALIENIQREDLNPIDLALTYEALIGDYGITHDELAARVQKSRAQITNTLALLRLGDYARRLLIEGKITQGHAKVLVNLAEDDCKMVLDSIIGQKLSAHETENLVKKIKDSPRRGQNAKAAKMANLALKNELKNLSKTFESLGVSAKINQDSLILRFKSEKKVAEMAKILRNIEI